MSSAKKTVAQPSTSSRRKSISKRPLVHSDDDDDDDGLAPSTVQRAKRARTTDTNASHSIATTTEDDSDMDVDVDTLRDSAQRSLSAADENRFLPEGTPTRGTSKKRRKSTSTKTKSQVLYSDDEASNNHVERESAEDDLSDLASPLSKVDEDEESESESESDIPPKHRVLKAKVGIAKGKAGKSQPVQVKGTQAKGLKDKGRERDILMKDERRLAVSTATTSRASSAAAQSQLSDLFSNDDLASSTTVDPLPDGSQPAKDPLGQTIPKKRKLPPIKKTKTASGATGTPTPTATTQKTAAVPVQELAKPSLPTSEQRKQALTGVRDIDLADSKIYAELFKGAGGNMPRSGLKNAEERRKELDKMRDEARARRAEEIKFTFDLQSQADKIARFEQRLRAEGSTVLHPNFLGAKFREEWEMERRHRRVTPKEEGEA